MRYGVKGLDKVDEEDPGIETVLLSFLESLLEREVSVRATSLWHEATLLLESVPVASK